MLLNFDDYKKTVYDMMVDLATRNMLSEFRLSDKKNGANTHGLPPTSHYRQLTTAIRV